MTNENLAAIVNMLTGEIDTLRQQHTEDLAALHAEIAELRRSLAVATALSPAT